MARSNEVDVTPLASPEEVKSFRQQQAEEWGQYIAVQQIVHGGALAYNPGDPVPASNVTRHRYEAQGLVAKVGSAEARKVIEAAHAAAGPAPVDLGEPVTLGVPVDQPK